MKMEFKQSQTLKNLTRAFAGECQDGAFYQYMADEATTNKLSYVSTILKQLATNEMAHAKVFYDFIGNNVQGGVDMVEIKATYPMKYGKLEDMLKEKAINEDRQGESVYPEFAKVAEKEGFEEISKKFIQIGKIEQCHALVLNQLYEKMKNNSLYSSSTETLWKCFNCGHQDKLKKAWKKCPICLKNQGMVKINLELSGRNIED